MMSAFALATPAAMVPTPDATDQFHRDFGARVDLFQIVDQLREVFDGIDVVVRRRGNQRHAFGRMAQAGDQLGHFHAGQLATFAGLGTLGDFDFQVLRRRSGIRR